MMKEPILLILAAGMGSRYGGLKQMDPIGPSGEVILDYSIFDARRAGFKRVVFLIKHEIEEDFRRLVGSRIEPYMEVRYAFQQVDMLPAPFAAPDGRTRPWGTGHAVLCCRELLDAPFVVINADDYYGVSAFRTAYEHLLSLDDDAAATPQRYMMVGYHVENTLSDHGHVSRGVCTVDESGHLTDVCERTHIIKTTDGPLFTEDGATYHAIPTGTLVSMNLWGFTPSFVDALVRDFPAFLATALQNNPQKAEFFLPSEVNRLLQSGEAVVQVLSSHDRWYGVTYQDDKPIVMQAISQMVADGLYPETLWK